VGERAGLYIDYLLVHVNGGREKPGGNPNQVTNMCMVITMGLMTKHHTASFVCYVIVSSLGHPLHMVFWAGIEICMIDRVIDFI